MAFAGSDPYCIFSGPFDPSINGVRWGAPAGEAGSAQDGAGWRQLPGRVTNFAACGGKLYASIYDAIAVRTDGPNPSWSFS